MHLDCHDIHAETLSVGSQNREQAPTAEHLRHLFLSLVWRLSLLGGWNRLPPHHVLCELVADCVQGLMSLPVLDLGGPNHLLGTALAGAVTRFWPVKPISSSGPSSSIFQSAKSSAILIVAGVAIQGFALPPRPSLLDVVFVLPLTLTSLGLFMGQAFSPSRKLSASVWQISMVPSLRADHCTVDISFRGNLYQGAVDGHANHTSNMATSSSDHLTNSDIIKDLLLSAPESGVHGRANGLWCTHELPWSDLRW